MRQGLLVLDSNCIGLLEDPQPRRRLLANARAACLDIAFSEINLLEVLSSPPEKRDRLLSAMMAVEPDAPLLPWPPRLLRDLGSAMVEGQSVYRVENLTTRGAIDSSESLSALAAEVRCFNSTIESTFSAMHDSMRREIQLATKEDRRAFDRVGVRGFLIDYWVNSDLRKHIAGVIWSAVGLDGEPPIAELEQHPAWSLQLDAEGVSLYQRGLVLEQPKRVHRMDLLQLAYLGASGCRVFATRDLPLLDAAQAVVSGRYPGARCMHIDSLLG